MELCKFVSKYFFGKVELRILSCLCKKFWKKEHHVKKRMRRSWSILSTITEPAMDSRAHLVNQDARREREEELYDRVSQRFINGLTSNSKKKFSIERYIEGFRSSDF